MNHYKLLNYETATGQGIAYVPVSTQPKNKA
jgi:hypothetical protein